MHCKCLSNVLLISQLLIVTALLPSCGDTKPLEQLSHQGSVASGKYQNLFAQVGIAQDAIDKRIESSFQQLFYGNPDSQALYYPAGSNSNGPLAYILDVNSQDTRSEGISYGMMIAVQLNKKTEFDALWNWAKTYMYQSNPLHPAYGYFAWSMKANGQANDPMPAPDGEEYFITALYFAAERWGNGKGIYAYKQQADQLLSHILHREIITGPTFRGEMSAGNLFAKDAKMVRFTPDLAHADHTDPSYHLPAFYQIWAKVGPVADRVFWQEATQVSRDYLVKVAHAKTALTPDYANFDGSPWAAPWRAESADFRYDAWRTAMNWSVDWAWWAKDPRQITLSNTLLNFFANQGQHNYQSLYSLTGDNLGGGQTTALVAMNATATLAGDNRFKQDFVLALWNKPVPTGQYRYYDGMLYLMGILHCAGEFKAWLPKN